MCFSIAVGSAPWRNRRVYKVVDMDLDTGELRSLVRTEFSWTRRRRRDDTFVIPDDAEIRIQYGFLTSERWEAGAGFYVFRTLRSARTEKVAALQRRDTCWTPKPLRRYEPVILVLEVKPEDFLFTDRNRKVATYRRVKLAEEQIDFDWRYV